MKPGLREGPSPHSRYRDLPPSNMPYPVLRSSNSSPALVGASQSSPVSDSSILSPSTIDDNQESMPVHGQPHKRRRRGSVGPYGGAGYSSKHETDMAQAANQADRSDTLTEVTDLNLQDSLMDGLDSDPYEANPEEVTHYIDKYFSNINGGIYHMFPRKPFILWLKSCRKKSFDDKMLLYSMLAMGTIFSDRPERVIAGQRFLRTARQAVEKRQHRLTLQLAQSRIILSLWYYATGALAKAWDSIGAAVRTVCALRYNIEPDSLATGNNQMCEYMLHPLALAECYRRTFWVVFILDVSDTPL